LLPLLPTELPPALLALADGTTFLGTSIGAPGRTVGEVVFNTALTGYQEILTDPSYCRQIVTLTYPHIGNTGRQPRGRRSGARARRRADHQGPAGAGVELPRHP
jgi:carbamoylphosphate synthase small subunit